MSRAPQHLAGERLSRLRALLQEKPLRRADMQKLLDVSKDTADRYLRILRASKEVHIARYDRNTEGGQPFAWFAYGDKPDAPKPRPFNDSEQSKRYYRKMRREDPIKFAAYLHRAGIRTKTRNRKLKGLPLVPADPMLAWIPRRAA